MLYGALIFWVENPSNLEPGIWGVLLDELHLPDPAVYLLGRRNPEYRQRQNERLSQFVTQMLVTATLVEDVPFKGGGMGFTSDELPRLTRGFSSLRFPPWHRPAFPTVLYGSDELILQVGGEHDVQLQLASRNREALERFSKSLDDGMRVRLFPAEP